MLSLCHDPGREGETMISFNGAHFPLDSLTCVRWYVTYPFHRAAGSGGCVTLSEKGHSVPRDADNDLDRWECDQRGGDPELPHA